LCIGARRAEQVFDVVLRVAAGGQDGDTLPAEEDVFVESVSRGIGFGEDFAAGRKIKTRTLEKSQGMRHPLIILYSTRLDRREFGRFVIASSGPPAPPNAACAALS